VNRAVVTTAAWQAAVAEFGGFALRSRDIAATIDHALRLFTGILAAPAGSVIKQEHERWDFAVLAGHGTFTLPEGTRYSIPAELAGWHAQSIPLVVEDWRAETRVPPPPPVVDLGFRAMVSVSLLVEGRSWGRIGAFFPGPRSFAGSDVDLARLVAHVLAAALERDRVERAHASLSAFGEFALATHTTGTTLERAAEVIADLMDAPMAAVLKHEDDAGLFRVMAARGAVATLLGKEFQAPPRGTPMPRGDQPFVITDWRAHPQASRVTSLIDLGVVASVSAPITVGDRTWGRAIAYFARPRESGDTDIDLLQGMAHILSAALDRNETESRLRETAEAFQRALLPARLPVLPGVEAACRYLPAHGRQVGGDWFDMLSLPDDCAGLVMGDVEGHDSAAAAIMGQVRTIVRTYAAEGLAPAEIMCKVNQFVTEHTDRLITCCYLELHPDELTLTGSSAGHPAPLLLDRSGEATLLDLDPDPPLGFDSGTRYAQRTWVLPPLTTLLMYTDGLVDDFPAAVHPSSTDFSALVGSASAAPIEEFADILVTPRLAVAEQRDDAAVLVVRLTEPVKTAGLGGRARRRLRPSPKSAPVARQFVRDILLSWGLPEMEEPAALAVSELVTNSVIHTTSGITLTLCRGPGSLWIGVFDESDRFVRQVPASPEDVGGRGLMVVESLASDWGVIPAEEGSGKTVWLELTTG
jgi:GAF domain-containing protein/anti-sigma regulatory factor (Ser/Thr protein kinase)